MNATELYLDTLNRSDSVLRRALEELTAEDLRKQPAGEGSNPIGWLVWHLSRARDSLVAGLSGQPTVWESDGWAARFGMEGNGPRFKPEDVHTFDPKDLATLTGYFEAVARRRRRSSRSSPLTIWRRPYRPRWRTGRRKRSDRGSAPF